MGNLQNKIDFVALVTVNRANANGDPLNGNRPRTDYDGFGEMSDVCLKRKIRNRMQDLGYKVFVQSDDRCNDGYDSLKTRADAEIGVLSKPKKEKELKKTDETDESKESTNIHTKEGYAQKACEEFIDVRSFGQVFAFKDKNNKDSSGVSIGIRGPVSIHQAVSLSPIDVCSIQITKSVNGSPAEGGRSSDTMGTKHFVKFGLYEIKGSINVQLAEKTGFSVEDADVIKECLRTLFVNDASSARPEGSMEVKKVYWWKHNCKDGQYSTANVHRSVKITSKVSLPTCYEDYDISIEKLEGLEPEIIEGL